MPWIVDLVRATGLPVGGAVAAVAIYCAAVSAEKEARPEALKDISVVLKDKSWNAKQRPSVVVKQLFDLTFGDNQLSVKCAVRSILSSILYLAGIAVVSFSLQASPVYQILWFNATYEKDILGGMWYLLKAIAIVSLIPDYFAIWKSRYLVKWISSDSNILKSLGLVILDIVLSILIASFAVTIYHSVGHLASSFSLSSFYNGTYHVLVSLEDIFGDVRGKFVGNTDTEILITSTLLTSLWTILALLSTLGVKVLTAADYTRRFTVWYFDVDKHPIRAVGIVAGAIVFCASTGITLVKLL